LLIIIVLKYAKILSFWLLLAIPRMASTSIHPPIHEHVFQLQKYPFYIALFSSLIKWSGLKLSNNFSCKISTFFNFKFYQIIN
jgi:hypothetical protein